MAKQERLPIQYENTGRRVHFNKLAKWKFEVPGYSAEVSAGLSGAARKVAELGGKDGLEHLELIDLRTGESVFSEIGDESSVGYDFWTILRQNPFVHYAFVHNHNTDGWLSEQDLETLLQNEQISVMIAARNDGVIYIAPKDEGVTSLKTFARLHYEQDMKKLRDMYNRGELSRSFQYESELLMVKNMLRDFVKGYFEYDG